jgi:hypothetical protein
MNYQYIWDVPSQEKEEVRFNREVAQVPFKCLVFRVVLLVAIPPLAVFIGTTQVGWMLAEDVFVRLTLESALPMSFTFYLALMLGVVLMACMFYVITRKWGQASGYHESIQSATSVATPMMLGGLVGLLPLLWFNVLIGMAAAACSIYLLYHSVPLQLRIPRERAILFSTLVLTLGFVVLVGILAVSAILWATVTVPVVDNSILFDKGL